MGKAKSNGGFTLLEMLMTMMILSFSMVILTNGALTIRRIYSQALAKADAQMILSQVETTLRNDLSFARTCTLSDDSLVTSYTTYANVKPQTLKLSEFEERFMRAENKRRLENISLVPYHTVQSGDDLDLGARIKYDYDSGYFNVEGLGVKIDDALTLSAEQFSIRALSDVTTVSGG